MSAFITRMGTGLKNRFQDAGGVYNFGGIIAVTGLIGAGIAESHSMQDAFQTVAQSLAGSKAAAALTAANIIFFWAGEEYYRAFPKGQKPNSKKFRRGHFLSGVGASILGAGLYCLGNPVLAIFSGASQATGKFGSAITDTDKTLETDAPPPTRISKICKELPLYSRAFGMGAAFLDVADKFISMPAREAIPHAILPAFMGVAYGLWARADIMVMRGTGYTIQAARYIKKQLSFAPAV